MTLGQLECPFDISLADDLSHSLEEESISVSWYEAHPECWILSVLYKEEQKAILRDKITTFFQGKNVPLPKISESILADKDWVTAVYKDFPPLTIGKFYIYGSHIQDALPTNLIPLHIEAATAFGSGQHESTEGCLRALTFLKEQFTFNHPLDMGCGSGILAISMAALWNVLVVACDNDPEAVRVTLENGKKNGVAHLIQGEVSEGFAALHDQTFDIITANILAGPLCEMAEDVQQTLEPGGFVILSGLLNWQAEDVLNTYKNATLQLFHQVVIGEWTTLIMQKDNHG
jgi:ribosomal protein L11 methyltransferase